MTLGAGIKGLQAPGPIKGMQSPCLIFWKISSICNSFHQCCLDCTVTFDSLASNSFNFLTYSLFFNASSYAVKYVLRSIALSKHIKASSYFPKVIKPNPNL